MEENDVFMLKRYISPSAIHTCGESGNRFFKSYSLNSRYIFILVLNEYIMYIDEYKKLDTIFKEVDICKK